MGKWRWMILGTFGIFVNYKPLFATPLPDAVGAAANSVFRIVPLHTEICSADDRALALRGPCLKPTSFIQKLRCNFMRDECSSTEICKIPFTESGSAFLTGDGRTLVSAFHVMAQAELLTLTLLGNTMLNYPPEKLAGIYAGYQAQFLLFNSDDELVYDTRDYVEAHRFSKIGDPLKAVGIAGTDKPLPRGIAQYGQDFAGVRLRKTLGKPLPFASRALRTDEVVWTLGFPMRTRGRQVNYDGFHIFANPGMMFSLSELALAFSFQPSAEADSFPLLAFSGDIVPGFSGGPLLNASGEIIGVVTGSLSNPDEYRGIAFASPVGVWR